MQSLFISNYESIIRMYAYPLHIQTYRGGNMSIFNKLKQGVADAGSKAKSTVETTRLKSQISKHEADINTLYFEIGKKVYSAAKNGNLINKMIETEVNRIDEHFAMIKNLEININAVWNQKECKCGKLVPLDAKFCFGCGSKFDPLTIRQNEMNHPEQTILLSDANRSEEETTANDSDSVVYGICSNCDAPLESDAKFCGDCGNLID